MIHSTDKVKGQIYWQPKVFDIQDAPKRVKAAFFASNPGSNGTFVSYHVYDEHKSAEEVRDEKDVLFTNRYGFVIEKGDDVVSDWLFENGARRGERVLINRWW